MKKVKQVAEATSQFNQWIKIEAMRGKIYQLRAYLG